MAANMNKPFVEIIRMQKDVAKSKMSPAVTEYSQIIATPALSRKWLPRCANSQRKIGTRKRMLPPKRQSLGAAFARRSSSTKRAIKVLSLEFIAWL